MEVQIKEEVLLDTSIVKEEYIVQELDEAENQNIGIREIAKGSRKAVKKPQYSPQKLRQALEAVENGMPVGSAAFKYKVPRTTLRNKILHKSPREYRGCGGFHSALGKNIEQEIVQWIIESANCGFPVTKDGVLTTVEYMNALHPREGFKKNRPTVKWYYCFLRRHPEIAQKRAEYVKRTKSSVTERNIRHWFVDVKQRLGEDSDILDYPERIWSMDESCFNITAKGELIPRDVGRNMDSDKENITTLFAVNALGSFAPPLTLYKYERIPAAASKSAPRHWEIGKSENGLLSGDTFHDYMGHVFLKFLKEKIIQRPVIVFLDSQTCHLTLHLSKLCRENGIILVSLYPNAMHILQPLHMAVFTPIKTQWKALKREWRMEHEGYEVAKFDLPALLDKMILNEEMGDNMKTAFRVTGLYPFNGNAVDYREVVPLENIDQEIPQVTSVEENFKKKWVDYFESKIDPDLLSQFKMTKERGIPWNGETRSTDLYYVWKDIVFDVENQTAQMN